MRRQTASSSGPRGNVHGAWAIKHASNSRKTPVRLKIGAGQVSAVDTGWGHRGERVGSYRRETLMWG